VRTPRGSVIVGGTGTTIEVTGLDETSGVMTVEVN
jgi:hypothetical protein